MLQTDSESKRIDGRVDPNTAAAGRRIARNPWNG
jgi:hypothetical protein